MPDHPRLNRVTAAGETGFWQAALRDPDRAIFNDAELAHRGQGRLTVDLLYGDLEDGQPTVTRFVMLPGPHDTWRCDATHHWRDVEASE
jgi:hypothetical protein